MTGQQANYSVKFTEDAREDVKSLDGSIQQQLRRVLEKKLAVNPEQYGAPLVGALKGYWSHHFASHRIIYRIYNDPPIVVVCAIGPRKAGHGADVYRKFEVIVEAGRAAKQIVEVLRPPSRKKENSDRES